MALEKHEKKLVETVEKAEKPHEKAEKGGTELGWGDRVEDAVKKGKKNIKKVADFMEEFESSGEKGQYSKRKEEEFQKKIEEISGTMEGKLSAKKDEAAAYIDAIIYDIEAESTLKASTLVNVLEEGVDIKKAKHLKKHQEIVKNIDLPVYKKLKLDFALALAEEGDKKAEGLTGFFKKNKDLVKSIIGLKKVPENFTELEMQADLTKLMQFLGVKDEKTLKKVNDNLTIGNLFANQNLLHLTHINDREVPQSKIYDRVVKNKMKLKFVKQLTRQEKITQDVEMAKKIKENPEELIKDFDKMSQLHIKMTLESLLKKHNEANDEAVELSREKDAIEGKIKKELATQDDLKEITKKQEKAQEALRKFTDIIIDNLAVMIKYGRSTADQLSKFVYTHPEKVLENSEKVMKNGGAVGEIMVIRALKTLGKESEAKTYLGHEELVLVTEAELKAIRKAEIAREDERRLAAIRKNARGSNYKNKVKVVKTKKPETLEQGDKKQPVKQETAPRPLESREKVAKHRHVREIQNAYVRTDTISNKIYAQIIGEEKLYEIDEATGNVKEVEYSKDLIEGLEYAGMINNGEYEPKGEKVYERRYNNLYKKMMTLKGKFGKKDKKEKKEKLADNKTHRPKLGERVKSNENIRSVVQAEDGSFWRVRNTDGKKAQLEYSESDKGPWNRVRLREVNTSKKGSELFVLSSKNITAYKVSIDGEGRIKSLGSKNITDGDPGSMSTPSKPEVLFAVKDDPKKIAEKEEKAAKETAEAVDKEIAAEPIEQVQDPEIPREKGKKVESDKTDPEEVAESKEEIHGLTDIIDIKEAYIRVHPSSGTLFAEIIDRDNGNVYYEINEATGEIKEMTDEEVRLKYLEGTPGTAGLIKDGEYKVDMDDANQTFGKKHEEVFKAITELNENFGEIVEEVAEELAEKPKSRPVLGEKVETNENVISLVEAGDGTFWRVRSMDEGAGVLDFSESKNGPWYTLLGYKEGVGGWKQIFNYDFYDKDDNIVYRVKFDGKKGIGFIGTANVGKKERGSLGNPIRHPENLIAEPETEKPDIS